MHNWRKKVALGFFVFVGGLLCIFTVRYALQNQSTGKKETQVDRTDSSAKSDNPTNNKQIPETRIGNVHPVRRAIVSARVSGTVEVLNIEEGMRISGDQIPSDPLKPANQLTNGSNRLPAQSKEHNFQIPPYSSDAILGKLNTTRAIQKLEERRIQIEEARIELQKAKRDRNRIRKAIEEGGEGTVYSRQDLEDFEHKAALAQKRLETSRTRYRQQAKRVSDHYITAPFAGEIEEKHTEKGEWIRKGDPLFTLIDTSRVRVIFYITERLLSYFERSETYTFTADAYPDKTFSGTVQTISPSTDEQYSRYKVILELENPDQTPLRPGMICRISIEKQTK